MFARLGCVVGVASPVLFGCSDRTPIAELSGHVTATIDDRALHVDVMFTEPHDAALGFAPAYAIEPGEHVLVSFRDQQLDLLFRGPASGYAATFGIDGEVAAHEPITVTLDRRADGRVDLVGRPASPFTLDVPATASAAQDLLVRWAPIAREPMEWEGFGCGLTGELGVIAEDTGTLTIPRALLADGRCDIGIRVRRSRATPEETVLAESTFTVAQVRSAPVMVTL